MFVKGTRSDNIYSYNIDNIEFDLAGGVELEDCTYGVYPNNQCNYSERKIFKDEGINVFDPERNGYVFSGWKLEKFDKENAYISSAGMGIYIKDGYYDTVFNEWEKFIKHIVEYKNPDTSVIEIRTGVYKEVLDISGDKVINLLDLVMMRKKIVGV